MVLLLPQGAPGRRGAVVTRCPAVTDLDQDPLTVIETGDWVEIDGDQGIVKVTKRQERPAG